MKPSRGKVLVKRVETAPSIPGGRILLTERTREDLTSQQMEVLDCGAPAVCEDDDCERKHIEGHLGRKWYKRFHPMAIHDGDWVLVAHRSLLETDQGGIYVVSQDDIFAVIQP